MIRSLGYHHALVAGDVARDLGSQIVGFTTGAGEDTGIDFCGHSGDQHFAKLYDAGMQIACMGIERGCLLAQGFYHPGVAMTHRNHVIVAVDVLAPIYIPELCAGTTHQV